MEKSSLSRRDFIKTSAALGGAAMLAGVGGASASAATATPRTAADQVPLGKTGIMLSRLGIGCGSNNGHVQTELGRDGFADLIHYSYDHGITYLDCCESYATFHWLAAATRGIPRDKLFIQSKMDGQPADVLAVIDHHRKVYDTDYIDSLLVHCMTRPGWTDEWKGVMDAFDTAQQRGWIRAKGVSCHSYPALQDATASDWSQVHLVRVNPQGKFMDNADGSWSHDPDAVPVEPVLQQIKIMHDKGRGVIGMKICGNGTFTQAADRERSIRFAMSNSHIDAVVIGMKSRAEVDQNIAMVNRALAA
jgi:predicted aldo/keto reductase-like oxidoreductase